MNPLKLTLLRTTLLAITTIRLCYGDAPEGAEKGLYLTSAAINVMDELVPLLPFKPNGHVACYNTTASKNADWTKYEISAVKDAGFKVKVIDLAELSMDTTIAGPFESCDIIFVGGGNTIYLLQEARRSGFDVLVEKKNRGRCALCRFKRRLNFTGSEY